ncbi:uncharacterized protein LOC117225393 [Megalopta genalis]|uniref:uncharacterized protein LOC117225393 n=1 Tax=Megalopta genalis TaxID=115081 RepID=UPI0014432A6A|nr:uncharacterized protein LOC117225393 [Megalopta genalis]
MDSEDRVMPNNLEYNESLISRIKTLRSVLRDLKTDLKHERLNLHQEIQMTILQKFVKLPYHRRQNCCPGRHTRIPCSPVKLYQPIHSSIDTSKTGHLACLGTWMYQRTIDDLQDELNSFEQRLSTRTLGSYRRKIYDLEAICSADLNRVRSRFVKSLQAFQNTIHSIEERGPWRTKRPACPCSTETPQENNTNGLTLAGPNSRNVGFVRSARRSRSVFLESDVRGTWWTRISLNRFSDSEMYSKSYRSSSCVESRRKRSKESVDSLKVNKSLTVIFPCAFKASPILF